MRDWHERPGIDLLLRGGGLTLLGIAGLTGMALDRFAAHGVPHQQPSAGQLLLAMVIFAAGSMGTALVVLGRHIFDRVTVSARWRPYDGASRGED